MVKSKIKLQPLGDRVVVQRDASEEVTTGGIVLPDSAKDAPARGTVMSVGDGIMMPDGSRVALQLTVGARVIFSSYGGEAINIDDEEYLLMRESDVLAVIE
jgi:chaperonin GroES